MYKFSSSYKGPKSFTPKTQRPILNQGVIEALRQASRDLLVCNILYAGQNGTSIRYVEPYEIKEQKLWAFCLTAGDIRQFSLHNIISVEITDQKYRPRWPVKIR